MGSIKNWLQARRNLRSWRKELRTSESSGRCPKHEQFAIGSHYASGEGLLWKSASTAAHWYRKAAERGHNGARFELGAMYAEGKGVPQNHAEAARWLSMAARGGYMKASLLLAKLGAPAEITYGELG